MARKLTRRQRRALQKGRKAYAKRVKRYTRFNQEQYGESEKVARRKARIMARREGERRRGRRR
jgi:hypothetical protein